MAALPEDGANAELHNDTIDERASSSSSSSSSEAMPSTPPLMQQMDRHSSSSSSDDDDVAADPGRIPAEVFELDPAEGNKDWSMMSTDSVFGLQVAPSSDFTGFFLAHPELMDISTPPRASTANANAEAEAEATTVLAPPFESIPELSAASMKGNNYSFAFPNLIEDKRPSSKKVQDEPPATEAKTEEEAQEEPAPPQPEAQASSKPEAAPENEAAKGGLFACFPCCS